MRAIVDTNVLVVANGRNTHADLGCQIQCVSAIREISLKGTVVLDGRDLILDEYRRHLNLKGEPGPGDAFFKHIHDNLYFTNRVERVSITAVDDEERAFEELPANTLDRSDRKFLAVAVVSKAPILNATDSDWHDARALISSLAVEVTQLCPQHAVGHDRPVQT
ncbi:MAG: hypothetical protein OXJ37_11200 [Bryobacterales bacterium]|nr:hypothetical protein [Bryobacterales bacterium]MDE0621189.1 hypothetical protein [Bryobacterales bacterium]